MLQAARRHESIDYVKPKGDVLAAPPSYHNKSDERELVDMHVHEFEFCMEAKKEKPRCTKCEKLIISGPTYHCVEYDDFILHKYCAESPTTDANFVMNSDRAVPIAFSEPISKVNTYQLYANNVRAAVKSMYIDLKDRLDTRLNRRDKAYIRFCLKFYGRIEELDRISKDLGAFSIDETLPLQHDNYLKRRMELLNEILEELYTNNLMY
ncbi:unnamed protein product [Dovyalis caffra]|uniref:DC1 domain-containing protein n=1 Tax=Dovyalis caffra TaxID=77055 RepID=A0AAV1S168_9ROSI|nr:unnamed protein product [Dovyalis caffra]